MYPNMYVCICMIPIIYKQQSENVALLKQHSKKKKIITLPIVSLVSLELAMLVLGTDLYIVCNGAASLNIAPCPCSCTASVTPVSSFSRRLSISTLHKGDWRPSPLVTLKRAQAQRKFLADKIQLSDYKLSSFSIPFLSSKGGEGWAWIITLSFQHNYPALSLLHT